MLKFFILLSILIIITIAVSRPIYESNTIHFVTKKEIENIVNVSQFFARMTQADLYARGQDSITSYKRFYLDNVETFTKKEKYILESLTQEIDLIPTKHLQTIPWKFVKLSTNIENGYPHTLEDTIMLPHNFFDKSKEAIKTTLLHEKIHVFQRKFPHIIDNLIMQLGFKRINSDIVPKDIMNLKRNNPDIEGIYQYNYFIPIQLYTSHTPSSLADSSLHLYDIRNKRLIDNANYLPSYINQSEHPYEVTAVIIPRILLNTQYADDYHCNITKKWCQDHL